MTAPRPALGTVLVIAKEPRPGRVKTRLVPPLTDTGAAAVAAAAPRDTLVTATTVPAEVHLLAFAGDASAWTPPGWRVTPQPDGGLDARLTAAFIAAAGLTGGRPAVLVGMDTPQFTAAQLDRFDPQRYDACLGPAADGGYWAIGFADPTRAADVIPGVPMSTDGTGAAQLDRMQAAGLRVQLLDELVDVDTVDAARAVARLVPGSGFAAAVTAALAGHDHAVVV